MTNLTHYDPFFIGFDNMLEKFNSKSVSFPPYNLFKVSDTEYGIELAVAGYSKEDITVSIGNSVLEITGVMKPQKDKTFIHKGITSKSFSRSFSVADTIEVVSAAYENGILTIALKNKLPENKTNKTITIV
jgi:molecular chaperone IbpA